MQKLLMKIVSKLPATPEPDDKDDSETQMVTRSSSGKKQKQKRQKTKQTYDDLPKPSLLPNRCCLNRIVWYNIEFVFVMELEVAAVLLYVDLQRKFSSVCKVR